MAVLAACGGEGEPAIVPGVDACAACGMVIDRAREACGYFDAGELVTFDSPGCLLGAYEEIRLAGDPVPTGVFFADYSEGKLHPAESITFLLTTHVPTVMESGVLSFADRADAETLKSHDDEILTDWLGLRTARGEPDRVLEIGIDGETMMPETVAVDKGELVLWRLRGDGLDEDLAITVRGYPEVGAVIVPADGAEATFRLMAVRPGEGFPVVTVEGDRTVGMLKVAGAHTIEEESM
jgi:hypothetical protein